MTVVEFFTASPLENMISCFSLRPDKVIFVGDGRRMLKMVAVYEKVAFRLGINAVFEVKTVHRNNIKLTVQLLEDIVATETECCFDLTGGDDLSLVAMGIVFERYNTTKKLQMQRFNIKNGRITDCDGDGYIPMPNTDVKLKCEEYVALYGGKVTSSVKYNKNNDTQLETLWQLSKNKPAVWNRSVNLLSRVTSVSRHYNEGKSVEISKNVICASKNSKETLKELKSFIKLLSDNALVKNFVETDETFGFTYGSNIVKKCLSKAGDVLELKVLSVASQLVEKNGTPYYSDTLSGVSIDWDGVFKNNGSAIDGTSNEIDVLLMRGLTPVFISCKNGGVEEIELYKLSAVAERFGGKYAKKVLIISSLNKKGASRQYFLQRAADMGVTVIHNANRLTEKLFAEKLRNI